MHAGQTIMFTLLGGLCGVFHEGPQITSMWAKLSVEESIIGRHFHAKFVAGMGHKTPETVNSTKFGI